MGVKRKLQNSISGLLVLVPALCLVGYGAYYVFAGSEAAVAGISIGVGILMATVGVALLLISRKE